MSFKTLASTVSDQYQETKRALSLFPYFDTWSEDVITECCRLSSIVEFPPDNIILGSEMGNVNAVFFILDGTCKMVYHIHARVKTNSYGKKIYKVYHHSNSKATSSDANSVGYTSILFNQKLDFYSNSLTSENVRIEAETEEKNSLLNDEVDKIGEIGAEGVVIDDQELWEENVQRDDSSVESSDPLMQHLSGTVEVHAETIQKENVDGDKIEGEVIENRTDNNIEEIESIVKTEQLPEQPDVNKAQVDDVETEINEDTYDPDQHFKVLEECKAKSKKITGLIEKKSAPEKPKEVKSFFVQMGLLYKGACFGLDKNPELHILSASKVKCLLIPRRFLLQHNPCNIWNRIRLFFHLYLLKSDEILNYFVLNRQWAEMKRKETMRIVSVKNIPNYTLRSEIPLSIRLLEQSATE